MYQQPRMEGTMALTGIANIITGMYDNIMYMIIGHYLNILENQKINALQYQVLQSRLDDNENARLAHSQQLVQLYGNPGGALHRSTILPLPPLPPSSQNAANVPSPTIPVSVSSPQIPPNQ